MKKPKPNSNRFQEPTYVEPSVVQTISWSRCGTELETDEPISNRVNRPIPSSYDIGEL
ncbi:20095_t:CDS:2 [Rhizophagus irregularis]|uniref:Uncharacterized protein n=1 Tax=Rhizophagus irregularis (strain DAOM 181602 / DAOM 197198 / MUCL 43194) TaxID=747089 RepID=U9TTJ0_RHIID|nr:20095_t:CDS:2 [Rhizophagus irregularis]